ncbi:hypothetical protein [Burkholderia mayonis]|uniref:Uncharacterized protein n=1 Tax=Burkholderia mayonis TaxID=1385591 RepID=A0A1B4G149_9BURK|nr:hypothetical protein [Burkholderia mayonis]AOJ09634.1 hypothetical protein WS71_20175 [Burkholderia mayonis]KVE52255.1 hypothetical protein WS71_10000 [Burkholderia mayonis]
MNVIIDGVQYVPAPAPCANPEALDVRFHCDDLGREVSIREYLGELLTTLWNEGEGFSGKRPFGNSGWYLDLYCALVAAGQLDGELDDDGCLVKCDQRKGDEIVRGLIGTMFSRS